MKYNLGVISISPAEANGRTTTLEGQWADMHDTSRSDNADDHHRHDFRLARIERLRYVQAMLGELRVMAEAERCDMLTYMIEMAYIEASDIVRGQRPLRVSSSSGQKRDAVA